MRRLHIVPGLAVTGNGIAAAAQLIAAWQRTQGDASDVVEVTEIVSEGGRARSLDLRKYDEVWVHGMWTRDKWCACQAVLKAGVLLVRMTHGSLSPVYLRKSWKHRIAKMLAGLFVERPLFRKCARIVVTGPWEEKWCRDWGIQTDVEIFDLKRCFDLTKPIVWPSETYTWPNEPLRALYLGHDEPLKGADLFRRAVQELNDSDRRCVRSETPVDRIDGRVVSGACGEELEEIWRWAQVLVLPTSSENFGLVVAEALERGKPVITTDGAPAWNDLKPEQGVYINGFCAGGAAFKIRTLKEALSYFADQRFDRR